MDVITECMSSNNSWESQLPCRHRISEDIIIKDEWTKASRRCATCRIVRKLSLEIYQLRHSIITQPTTTTTTTTTITLPDNIEWTTDINETEDNNREYIECVLDHDGRLDELHRMELLVHWSGHPGSDDEWIYLHKIYTLPAVQLYITQHSELLHIKNITKGEFVCSNCSVDFLNELSRNKHLATSSTCKVKTISTAENITAVSTILPIQKISDGILSHSLVSSAQQQNPLVYESNLLKSPQPPPQLLQPQLANLGDQGESSDDGDLSLQVDTSLQCSLCARVLCNYSSLARHMRLVHKIEEDTRTTSTSKVIKKSTSGEIMVRRRRRRRKPWTANRRRATHRIMYYNYSPPAEDEIVSKDEENDEFATAVRISVDHHDDTGGEGEGGGVGHRHVHINNDSYDVHNMPTSFVDGEEGEGEESDQEDTAWDSSARRRTSSAMNSKITHLEGRLTNANSEPIPGKRRKIVSETKFQCAKCLKYFSGKQALQRHILHHSCYSKS